MTDTTIRALEAQTGGTDLGAISVAQGGTPVKIGKSHLVAADGADVAGSAGIASPNGSGVLGWLRGIYDRLAAGIGRTWTLGSGSDSVSVVQGSAWAVTASDGGGSLTVDGQVAISGAVTVTQGNAGAQAWPVSGPLTDAQLRAAAVPVSGVLTDAQLRASPVTVLAKPNELGVSAAGAAAAAVTLTLPAVAGQYHLIDAIEITCYATAAGTGGATPVTVTSTNLPGNTAWTFPSGRAVGTVLTQVLTPNRPVRSAAPGVATTIVCPATTGVIWRINVFYTTAP